MDDLRKVLLQCFADMAWLDATAPAVAMSHRQAVCSDVDAATYEKVMLNLGKNAAVAWRDGELARRRYQDAVSKALIAMEKEA